MYLEAIISLYYSHCSIYFYILFFYFHLPHLIQYFLPGQLDVGLQGKSGTNCKPQNVGLADLARRDVDLPSIVDLFVERLVDSIAGSQPEADQAQLGRNRQVEPLVGPDQSGKFLSKFDLKVNDIKKSPGTFVSPAPPTCCLMCF